MSTVKISELPEIPRLNEDTTQTLVAGVDLVSGITGKITTKTLAQSLYSNDVLNVGNNAVVFPGVVAQFVSSDPAYIQVNVQNTDGNGSSDMVLTADVGTDTDYYIDMGILGSLYEPGAFNNLGNSAGPLDGYLVVQGSTLGNAGGNLIIGTASSNTTGLTTKIVSGGSGQENIVAEFGEINVTINNDLVVDGSITGPTITAINTYATSGYDTTNVSFIRANTAGTFANGAFARANLVGIFANGAFALSNTNSESISSINLTLLNAQNYANGAFAEANSAASYANGAFTKANNALANTSGTFGGNLVIAGQANVLSNMIIANSTYDYTNTSLFKIVGSTGAVYQPPANPGYMLSITGVDGVASRVVNSSYGTNAYALFAGRKGNGTAGSPTAVANNDVIARFSGSGYNGSAFTSTGQGRIDIVASEDFSVANTGSRIEFYNVAPKTNTVMKIATFNATDAYFTGVVSPQKGFIYTPRVMAGNTTSLVIDFSSDSMVKMQCNADCTVSFTNYTAGKVVEVWMTNVSGAQHSVTHGCSALNSTNNGTTKNIPASSSMKLQYFSIDGDLANTFVAITQG